MNIHDITLPVSESLPVYPGDPPFSIRRVADVARGDPFTLSAVSMGSHTGTHVDAPSHLLADGATLEQIPLEVLVGDALVLSLPHAASITAETLEAADVAPDCQRLLLKTGRADGHLSEDAARWLVGRKVRLVGIDSPSVDAKESQSLAVHRILLESGVIVVENLRLDSVSPGSYTLLCLPIKLMGCDGAPARAVLLEAGTLQKDVVQR